MGLISKIEDKLSSDKGHSQQKSSYEDQSSNSHLRHPVGSSTTSQGYGSSTTGTTGSHGMPGSDYKPNTTDVGRDGYGSSPGAYGSSGRTDPRDAVSSGGIGGGHSSGGYDTGRTDPRDAGLSGGHGTGPREPYDPYSSKGQSTAANATHGISRDEYGSSNTYANEPNVPRSREGGIMNPGSHPSAHNADAIPTAGGQRVGSTNVNDPYSTSTQHSSGHPIRDAALGGAAGSAVAGHGHGHDGSSHNPRDVSYVNRSSGETGGMGSDMSSASPTGGMMGSASGMGSTTQTGGMAVGSPTIGGSSGMDPDKMGGAYAKGYRDGMEHAKEQMGIGR